MYLAAALCGWMGSVRAEDPAYITEVLDCLVAAQMTMREIKL
jgi:hypothetical protein